MNTRDVHRLYLLNEDVVPVVQSDVAGADLGEEGRGAVVQPLDGAWLSTAAGGPGRGLCDLSSRAPPISLALPLYAPAEGVLT